ncbi:MAG: UDP-N-acetylmuramate dehydrogenase [Treponema sp.]|nr:UDP-N-acetylmuramate dehydrogenase [Treponema sp.]
MEGNPQNTNEKTVPVLERVVRDCLESAPCDIEIRHGEPMANHCTFRVGGPADCFLRPSGDGFPAFAAVLLARAGGDGVPVFVLGGGANIVVADPGIRGIVLDTGGWAGGAEPWEGGLRFRSGTRLDDAAEAAARAGLSGLEFLAGMPGTVGGAVWMNARCYGREISDALHETEVLDLARGSAPGDPQERLRLPADPREFGYKRSPFQDRGALILSASFRLSPGDPRDIRAEMEGYRRDRRDKGHFRFPSAGSVFKNNPAFGGPAGKIIGDLGLRGLRVGGAQVAPWHGNIIVNTGGATASDIRALADEVAGRVMAATGLGLEPEILFVPG